MKNKYNTLTCLFGHHDYSERWTKDKTGRHVRLCRICQRNGYYQWGEGREAWFDYNEKGNWIYTKWDNGAEYWYDEEGNCIRTKGFEREHWLDNNERWVDKKPKNWKYAKQIQ